MSENIGIQTGEAGANTPATGDVNKTFSQEDVNRIVSERLAKEKTKNDAALVQREQELAQRELQLSAKEKLSGMGLPLELLGALNTSSAEALDASLAIISKHMTTEQPRTLSGCHGFNQSGMKPHDFIGDADTIREAMGLD